MYKQLIKREYFLNKALIKIYSFIVLVTFIGSVIYEHYANILRNYEVIYFPLQVVSDLGMISTIFCGIAFFIISLIKDIQKVETWTFFPVNRSKFINTKIGMSFLFFLIFTLVSFFRNYYYGNSFVNEAIYPSFLQQYLSLLFEFLPLIIGSYFTIYVVGILFLTLRKEKRVMKSTLVFLILVTFQLFLQGLAFTTRSNYNLFGIDSFITNNINLLFYFNIYDYLFYGLSILGVLYLNKQLNKGIES